MRTLIKSTRIVNSQSPFNGEVKDVLIENGIITQIADQINDNRALIFEANNCHLSAGWVDLSSNLCDPGFEYKEDIATGLEAAAFGGFTTLAVTPNTNPITDSKGVIEYKVNRCKGHAVQIKPIGALTEKSDGKNLSELYDMHQNGAIAFSDGKNQISTSILSKALMYLQQFDGLLITHPTTNSLNVHGQVNESVNSSLTGLKGIPSLTETLQIQHDLSVLKYTAGKLHFNCISTAQSVQLIAEAKKQGLKVTCDIAAHQIAFDDTVVNTFDTNYKVFPPFRTKDDVAALLKGLIDGTIDAICSDHTPEDIENKVLEFDLAHFGIIGLQTAYAVVNTQLKKHLTAQQIVEKFAKNPRHILGLKEVIIEEGADANVTLFDPELNWVFTEESNLSKSKNSPFLNQTLTGKALAICNNGHFKSLI